MIRVLWFSRHKMTADQLADLEYRLGESVEIKQVSTQATSWRDVAAAGDDCDILAVVLPTAILADLTNPVNNTKLVIRAINKRVPTGKADERGDATYLFQHNGWEVVERIEVVTRPLCHRG